jgi:hypothetical protein
MADRKYRTSGLTTTGTSPIAATTKKKSKSKRIWKAVGIAALGAAGLSAFGGWGGGTGMTFFSGLKSGVGKISGGFGSLLGNTTPNALSSTGIAGGVSGLSSVKTAASTKLLADAGSDSESGVLGNIFNKITDMSSGTAFTIGSVLEAIGAATDTSAADSLAFNTAQHEDLMDYRYAALETEAALAEADLAMKNRVAAQSGTFMGHSNPITSGADGVPSTGPGYTPKPAASFPEFHPTGGLLS